MPDRPTLHPVSRRHLAVLSDRTGILQHAIGSWPDPDHGHCVDDIARALQVDLLHQHELGWDAVEVSARRAMRFLTEAFDHGSGRFRNFRSIAGAWIGGVGSDDCQGRAVLALGEAMAAAPDSGLRDAATELLEQALPAALELGSPRAQASVLLACAAVPDGASDRATAALQPLASGLNGRFVRFGSSAWPWPEQSLTYENALLPRALIVAGHRLGDEMMTRTGLVALDWLIDAQTSADGHFSPIGNGWWTRGGVRSQFDQQPIEATATILAAAAALEATGETRYGTTMEQAFAWFLGANDRDLPLADPERGASRDGLTPRGVNTNEGAESTLMWLMAAEHMRAYRDDRPRPGAHAAAALAIVQ